MLIDNMCMQCSITIIISAININISSVSTFNNDYNLYGVIINM